MARGRGAGSHNTHGLGYAGGGSDFPREENSEEPRARSGRRRFRLAGSRQAPFDPAAIEFDRVGTDDDRRVAIESHGGNSGGPALEGLVVLGHDLVEECRIPAHLEAIGVEIEFIP